MERIHTNRRDRGDRRYTYEDYLAWPDDVRYELIDGVAYLLAAPSTDHQRMLGDLHGFLWTYLRGKPCQPYTAPVDLRFTEDRKTGDVVQPDLLVVCEKDKVRPEGIVGAPSLIVEILSPSTAMLDFTRKKMLYERNGVPEYWIVSPSECIIAQYNLVDGKYIEMIHDGGTIASPTLGGFVIDLNELFTQRDTAIE